MDSIVVIWLSAFFVIFHMKFKYIFTYICILAAFSSLALYICLGGTTNRRFTKTLEWMKKFIEEILVANERKRRRWGWWKKNEGKKSDGKYENTAFQRPEYDILLEWIVLFYFYRFLFTQQTDFIVIFIFVMVPWYKCFGNCALVFSLLWQLFIYNNFLLLCTTLCQSSQSLKCHH